MLQYFTVWWLLFLYIVLHLLRRKGLYFMEKVLTRYFTSPSQLDSLASGSKPSTPTTQRFEAIEETIQYVKVECKLSFSGQTEASLFEDKVCCQAVKLI